MPYQKTKEGRLVNEVTLGDGYPLSNDLQPLKIGGEASVIEISHPLPNGSDNGLFKVNGDLDITGTLKTKLSHDLIYDFDDEVNTLAQAKIDALVDSAPAALDTLNELAAALNDDASFSTTVTNSLALKAPLAAPAFTGNATFDSTTLAIDATNNRVGIGTTSPDDALDIGISGSDARIFFSGNAGGGGSGILYKDSGGSARYALHFEDDDKVILSNRASNGTVQIRANTSTAGASGEQTIATFEDDKVGIGTTSPQSALHVEEGDIRIDTAQNGTQALRFSDRNGTEGQLQYNSQYLKLRMLTDAADGTDTKRLTVLGGQDATAVGIGTDDPTTTLDVEGTVSYKHTAFSTAGPTDNVDVSDTTVLEVDTSSNNVIIGGFTGGVQGQILYIVKTNTANFIQLEHNEGGGSQDIFITTGSDERVVGYGGYTLYCNGTSWFSLSNPTGGSDAG